MKLRKKKKEEPTFYKIENGMVFKSKDRTLVGLPTEVEEMTLAEGAVVLPIAGKAKGAKYTKVKYHWHVISGSPLPLNEMEELKKSIATTSGTIVASLDNAVPFPAPAFGNVGIGVVGNARAVEVTVLCKKCGASNLKSGKFCSNCGHPLN
jgi:predicted RNA-binding Zn-ribbon protein involved in translation (DUF1610 family)